MDLQLQYLHQGISTSFLLLYEDKMLTKNTEWLSLDSPCGRISIVHHHGRREILTYLSFRNERYYAFGMLTVLAPEDQSESQLEGEDRKRN